MGFYHLVSNLLMLITFPLVLLNQLGTAYQSTDKVKIELIPNTQLFTGTFYTVDLKFEEARLTLSNSLSSRGNHLQISYGIDKPKYLPGSMFYNDAQWMIIPAEETGYYQFVSKSKTKGVVALEGASSDGEYVVLFMDAIENADYLKGGTKRDEALWSFEPDPSTNDSMYYSIYNKKFPKSGIMTFTDTVKEQNGDFFVQVYTSDNDTRNISQYDTKIYYLWKFTAVTYKLSASITELSSNNKPIDYYLERSEKRFLFTSAGVLNEGNFVLNVSTTMSFKGYKATFTFKFTEPLTIINTEVSISTVVVPGTLTTRGDLMNGVIETSYFTGFNYDIGKQYYVVERQTCANVSGYFLKFKGTEKINATLSVTGVTDQITFGRVLTGKPQRVIGPAIKWHLEQAKFRGKLVKVEKNAVLYDINGEVKIDVPLAESYFLVKKIGCDIAAMLKEIDDPGLAA